MSCRLRHKVEKYGTAGQATDDNMVHAHCMLDNKGYKHTHTEHVILIAFPQQQWLYVRTRHSVTLYVHCLASFSWPVSKLGYSACPIYYKVGRHDQGRS